MQDCAFKHMYDGKEVDILNCYPQENNVDRTKRGRHYFLGDNNSICLLPYHLTFILSCRRPTLVWHKPENKQCLIKETNINKHLHHIEPLVVHVEMYTIVTRSAVCATQSRTYRMLKCRPTRKVAVNTWSRDHVPKSREGKHAHVYIPVTDWGELDMILSISP